MISIIICTRNRVDLLERCLNSFSNQTLNKSHFEVLIIDNGSKDDTQQLANRFSTELGNFYYHQMPVIGLSYARNYGYQVAQGDWVAFIDDDARVPSNFVARILWVIENYGFDCFGGTYTAWYPFGKPKWLSPSFGNKELLRDSIGEISDGFLSGGIMVCRKDVMEQLGGFSTEIGMTQQLGYGEDDEIQIRMRKAGYVLGFDPLLKMEHAVLPHKFKLSGHFKAAFAKGRDRALLYKKDQLLQGIFLLLRSLFGLLLKRLPVAFYKWCTKSEYYWQNLIYDSFLPIAYYLGHLKGITANKS